VGTSLFTRAWWSTALLFALCLALPGHAQQNSPQKAQQKEPQADVKKDQRVALVIGNSAYKTSPLKNPVNDAKDMANKLRGLGFVVIERSNLGIRQIGSTLREFRARLVPGGVALVYYAGHGLQIKGENYLPAVDADIAGEEDVPNQSLAMRQIMDVLADAKTRLNLVFLDACRNNPYARTFRNANEGLSRISAPSGTLISFATRPGSVAADGVGRNGLYTGALLQQMANAGQPIEQVLKRVVTSVKAGSKNQQEPWMEGSIEGEFCFGNCAGGAALAQASPLSDDRALWESVRDSRDASELKAYLAQFPSGLFATLAAIRIRNLEQATVVAAASPAPATATASPAVTAIPSPAAAPLSAVPGARQTVKDCADCPEMVVIPGGSFDMGSTESGDEQPVHRVTVASFLIGKTEVTQGQWKAVMGGNPSQFSACGDDCPVESVNWNEAQDFARRLSQKTGKSYRLPSEAEWEYAARAGTRSRWSFGDAEALLTEHAWYAVNSQSKTQPVARKKPNAFGLHDMHGNVWEWTQDCWNTSYSDAPANASAWTEGDCGNRVVRGGSWSSNDPVFLRSAVRVSLTTASRFNSSGLRIVRMPDAP
jgi:formylglycine-generating enzyme required for sulfatase activity